MMKALFKGLFYALNRLQLSDHMLLLPFEKRERIANAARAFGAEYFVETGSYHGETARYMAPFVEQVYSIELDPRAIEIARTNCAAIKNITFVQGSSDDALPTVLAGIRGRVLFWLDAHYQLSMSRGRRDCPLFEELSSIFNSSQIEPLILIDDARKFLGINGWPSLAAIKHYMARMAPEMDFRVSFDMVAIGRFSM